MQHNIFLFLRSSVTKLYHFINFIRKKLIIIIKQFIEFLRKEISLALPSFSKERKGRSIIASLVTSFISLAYEGFSSYLHNKR